MDTLAGVGVVMVYAALIGLLMTGPRGWRCLLLVVGAGVGLATPLLLREVPSVSSGARGMISLGLAGTYLRFVDLATERRALPAARRVLHAFTMMEMRTTRRAAPRLDVRSLAWMVVLGGVSAAAFAVVVGSRPLAIRYLAACVAAYVSVDALCALFRVVWSALGFELPVLHDSPIRSRTVAEFWGQRWNRIVSGWLRVHCFLPLARRRRPLLGLALAFLASGALHAYIASAALDRRAGLFWGLFFVVQLPFVLLERALRVESWRPLFAHGWTIFAFSLTSPLFVEPLMRAAEVLQWRGAR